MRPIIALLLLVAALPARAEIEVSGAWARATPPGADTGAIYLELHNRGEADALLGVSADVSDSAELHTHLHEQGMMRMTRVERIALPEGGVATLKPHGDHVMLFGLHRALKPGETVTIELRFEHQPPQILEVLVLDGRRQ